MVTGMQDTQVSGIHVEPSLMGHGVCSNHGNCIGQFHKTAFTTKKNYGRGEREAQWALAQRTLHGLQPPESLFTDKNNYTELSEIAEQAKRRAEVARLRELHTLKGHVESVVKLKGLDIDTIQQHYTV
ncbi:hypothetical protein SAY87_017074 [Trapa incisa]|uniref:Plasma membrane H+-ATPase n=1 Tax=Trapa incisa TaxID=236973 RepID=A0AAN7LDG8_9MYRT|nr:hypothetical protein SAY87_017074 [Trapa incisa]